MLYIMVHCLQLASASLMGSSSSSASATHLPDVLQWHATPRTAKFAANQAPNATRDTGPTTQTYAVQKARWSFRRTCLAWLMPEQHSHDAASLQCQDAQQADKLGRTTFRLLSLAFERHSRHLLCLLQTSGCRPTDNAAPSSQVGCSGCAC